MALCRMHQIRHDYGRGVIQDWVQLPTKTEMDLWRDENTPGWRVNFRVVTKVIITPSMEKKEWKKNFCQV